MSLLTKALTERSRLESIKLFLDATMRRKTQIGCPDSQDTFVRTKENRRAFSKFVVECPSRNWQHGWLKEAFPRRVRRPLFRTALLWKGCGSTLPIGCVGCDCMETSETAPGEI